MKNRRINNLMRQFATNSDTTQNKRETRSEIHMLTTTLAKPIPKLSCNRTMEENMTGGLRLFPAKATYGHYITTSFPQIFISGEPIMKEPPTYESSSRRNVGVPNELVPMNLSTMADHR
jgi:hypothetical protein